MSFDFFFKPKLIRMKSFESGLSRSSRVESSCSIWTFIFLLICFSQYPLLADFWLRDHKPVGQS